jgi:hypothetical protein
MNTIVSRKFVGPARWVLVVGCLAILAYGAALGYGALRDQDYLNAAIGGLILIVGLAGAVIIPRQRCVVSETYVEKRRLLSTRVLFDDVKWVRMHLGEMIISDGASTISINRVAENGRQLFTAAAEQLTLRPDIDYRGDPDTLAIHFGSKPTTAKDN